MQNQLEWETQDTFLAKTIFFLLINLFIYSLYSPVTAPISSQSHRHESLPHHPLFFSEKGKPPWVSDYPGT